MKWAIIGVRRSGLHAVANWLFPMMEDYIYLNNYELGKLHPFELRMEGLFNLIVGLENKEVPEVLKYTEGWTRIWVIRNWDDVLKSQRQAYKDLPASVREYKIMESERIWKDISNYVKATDEYCIEYEKWNTDELYRLERAEFLGLEFDDSNKEKIFGYGKSSFL